MNCGITFALALSFSAVLQAAHTKTAEYNYQHAVNQYVLLYGMMRIIMRDHAVIAMRHPRQGCRNYRVRRTYEERDNQLLAEQANKFHGNKFNYCNKGSLNKCIQQPRKR